MQEINPIIFNLVKNISEENKAKIMAVTKIIKNNIIEDCKEDVEKLINAKIEDSLAIPKNVVLHKDRVQTRQISDEEYQKFEEEVFEMKRIMLENAVFIDQLNIEWNSYQIDDRVAVEGRTIKLAEEALNSISYDSDILLNNVRKTSNWKIKFKLPLNQKSITTSASRTCFST